MGRIINIRGGDFAGKKATVLYALGRGKHFAIDITAAGDWFSKRIPLEDLVSVEIVLQDHVGRSTGAVVGGLAGAALFGVVGAACGVLASSDRKSDVVFQAEFKDGRVLLASSDFKTFSILKTEVLSRELAQRREAARTDKIAQRPSADGVRIEAAMDRALNFTSASVPFGKLITSLNKPIFDSGKPILGELAVVAKTVLLTVAAMFAAFVILVIVVVSGTPSPSSAQHTAPAPDSAATEERARFTKLRPDLDAHEYWARRCQPYRDRAASLPSGSMDAGIAVLAIRVCTKYEGFERDNTASMREYFEKGNDGERLAMPASLRMASEASGQAAVRGPLP
jgi:hypothetical protein